LCEIQISIFRLGTVGASTKAGSEMKKHSNEGFNHQPSPLILFYLQKLLNSAKET
jgi:hypothetical protein